MKKKRLLPLLSIVAAAILPLALPAQLSQPEEAARAILARQAEQLGLAPNDIAAARLSHMTTSRHNGLSHLYFQQMHEGAPVYNAVLNVSLSEEGEVVALGNRFVPRLAEVAGPMAPQISPEQALLAVLQYHGLPIIAQPALRKGSEPGTWIADAPGIALQPVEIYLAYQPVSEKEVRLAWNVNLYETAAQHWWDDRVDALTGKVLNSQDWVVHCAFDQPHAHCASHQRLGLNAPNSAEESPLDGSAYRVYPLTVESPNHGSRALIAEPADSTASPFGWHDTDGVPGAEFTITRGNNVHAYHDIFNLNSSAGDEPDGGEALQFDFPLDLAASQPYTQIDPLVTNLFYWNNLMHDVWYQYGFDEASGNFQATNYSGLGNAGDHVRAEALDGSGTNNANFATPPDGSNPRMQMYLWGGTLPNLSTDSRFQVSDSTGVLDSYLFVQAGFGGDLPAAEEPLNAALVLVEDDTDPASDGCDDLLNAEALAGKVALIDRGSCEFGLKVLQAENAGAIAAIICNNAPGDPIVMGAGQVGGQVGIPSIMIALEDCNAIKAAMPGLSVSLSAPELNVPNPGPSGLSSDLDNGVIVHEYTHGISIRLTGGAGNSGCLSNQEQAGEGWSDWFGLVMTTTADMTPGQPRGIGTYVTAQPTNGDGIRTYPYSRDMEVNPHTYANINGESVPHGVGSVWCVMIWDLYWNLVEEYGYDEDLYFGQGGNNIAMQLVLDGLKLQPCNPTFIEARDAILQADLANNQGANQCLIWETFARRGLGFSAQAGGQEAFDIPDACNFTFRVNKTAVAEANAGDIITYELEIINGRTAAVDNGTVTDILPQGATLVEGSATCPVSVADGVMTIGLGEVPSGQVINCSYQLQLPEAPFTYASFTDGAENGLANWNVDAPTGSQNWLATANDSYAGASSFFARNLATPTEQVLTIAAPQSPTGEVRAISFWHRYNTEDSWDGGIVEISPNGVFWLDAGTAMIQNGYEAPLNDSEDNPLANQPAFHGNSGGWVKTIISLENLSWPNVFIRFRFGSDGAVGGEGWYVDEVEFLSDFTQARNIACVGDEAEQLCSEAVTIVYGEAPVNTREQLYEGAWTVSPNPSPGKLEVAFAEVLPAGASLQVAASDGRILGTYQAAGQPVLGLELGHLPKGVYFLRLSTPQGQAVKRVVLQP